MVYTFSSKNRGSKFLEIELLVDNVKENKILLQLPSWRPGRYELANFAKNIQKFDIQSMEGDALEFEKKSKDQWEVVTKGVSKFKVIYNYYANELNAGSTWVDQHQIYVNPVNCCLYVVGRESESVKIILNEKKNERVATGMKKFDNHYVVDNYDMFADSPFVVSDNLKQNSYNVEGVKFNIWFQGECKPDWVKLKKDFKAFTKVQLSVMGDFPFDEYHFIYQILPQKSYHGVEHLTSTIISYGPGYCIMQGQDYEELLGVSSHELFHAWNIKSIRPDDMFPYDFSKENYTKMGYLAEGVTTYYGDLFLKRSGVFSTDQFLKQINKTLDRHFFNYGAKNLSVADSSFDTWLDGYVRGIPNRKSSIYTEGSILAMATDLLIREASNGKKSLDTVLNKLFQNYSRKGRGVNELDYKEELEKAADCKFDELWNNYYYGTGDYFDLLKSVLPKFGFDLTRIENPKSLAGIYGIYTEPSSNKIILIAPDSPGHKGGLNVSDEIISINEILLDKNNANDWANYFKGKLRLVIKKDGLLESIDLKPNKSSYFDIVRLVELESPKKKVLKRKKSWLETGL
jgi:predicted metalloprotease with PDZ domain